MKKKWVKIIIAAVLAVAICIAALLLLARQRPVETPVEEGKARAENRGCGRWPQDNLNGILRFVPFGDSLRSFRIVLRNEVTKDETAR